MFLQSSPLHRLVEETLVGQGLRLRPLPGVCKYTSPYWCKAAHPRDQQKTLLSWQRNLVGDLRSSKGGKKKLVVNVEATPDRIL